MVLYSYVLNNTVQNTRPRDRVCRSVQIDTHPLPLSAKGSLIIIANFMRDEVEKA